jgi:hypothetical protein
LSATQPLSAFATEEPSPTETDMLEACDTALNDQIDQNIEQSRLIHQLKSAAVIREERIRELDSASNKFYNNPVVMTTLGVVVGLVAGAYVTRR